MAWDGLMMGWLDLDAFFLGWFSPQWLWDFEGWDLQARWLWKLDLAGDLQKTIRDLPSCSWRIPSCFNKNGWKAELSEFKWVVTTCHNYNYQFIPKSLAIALPGRCLHAFVRQVWRSVGGWGFAVEEKLQWHAMAISQSVNFSSSDLTIL